MRVLKHLDLTVLVTVTSSAFSLGVYSAYPVSFSLQAIGQAVSDKKMFETVDDGRTTDRRQTDWYTISSPS